MFQLDPEDPKKVGVGVGGVEARKEPFNATELDLVYFASLLSMFVPSMVFNSFLSLWVMISDSLIIYSRHLGAVFSSLVHFFLVHFRSVPF